MSSRNNRGPTRPGRLIREHRQTHGLTHEDVCNQMRERIDWSCSPATVQNLEVGRVQTPRFSVQRGIAAVLGRPVNELWPEA